MTYQIVPYLPLLGELGLRVRTGRWWQKLSVPLLIDEGEVILDSFAIAQHVDQRRGSAPARDVKRTTSPNESGSNEGGAIAGGTLFPEKFQNEITHWNQISEAMLSAGRARVLASIVKDPEAVAQSVPFPLPAMIKQILGQTACAFLVWKYSVRHVDARAFLHEKLSYLSQHITGPGSYLLGQFSYADIAMAAALQVIEPVADEYLRVASKMRKHWHDPVLAAEFPQLLAWRNALYERHRRA